MACFGWVMLRAGTEQVIEVRLSVTAKTHCGCTVFETDRTKADTDIGRYIVDTRLGLGGTSCTRLFGGSSPQLGTRLDGIFAAPLL